MANAVATREEERPASPIVRFKHELDVVASELTMLDEAGRGRMKNAALVAINKDPKLLGADRASFFMAVRMCAEQGLVPDGVEATMQTYRSRARDGNGKEIWIEKVQYMPMIRGVIKRVLQSGKVATFWAERVHEGEAFAIDTSHGDRRPVHTFNAFKRTTPIVGFYAAAKLASGAVDCEAMSVDEIERIRKIAKTQNVWESWYEEKAKVAVMRRLAKRLPLSSEDMAFMTNEEEHDLSQAAPSPMLPARTPLQQKADAARAREEIVEPEPIEDAVIVEDEADHWTNYRPVEFNPESKAGQQGQAAFTAGLKLKACPYDEGTEQAEDWIGGWHDAKGTA